jgi:octaprenyl-diphosphate synthase
MTTLDDYLRHIETRLEKALPDGPDCLLRPIKDLLGRGGKRWRPLLAMLISEGLGAEGAVLPLVPLIEFSHNASLIHDDIEDNSPLRRGKSACHILYGNDAALNSGSYLYFLAAGCIQNWEAAPAQKARVYNLWTNYLCRLHEGQALDIFWHNNFSVIPAVTEYLRMCANKTGCLAEFAAALALETSGSHDNRLARAACDLGVAFQIMDDVKNLRGAIVGKKGGDDVIEGKKSLPVILFCDHRASAEGKLGAETAASFVADSFAEARKVGGGDSAAVDSEAVRRFVAALEEDHAIDEAEKMGAAMLDEAFAVFRDYPWARPDFAQAAFDEFRALIV